MAWPLSLVNTQCSPLPYRKRLKVAWFAPSPRMQKAVGRAQVCDAAFAWEFVTEAHEGDSF